VSQPAAVLCRLGSPTFFVRGPDNLRNVTVSWCVIFYKFSVSMSINWQNIAPRWTGFAGHGLEIPGLDNPGDSLWCAWSNFLVQCSYLLVYCIKTFMKQKQAKIKNVQSRSATGRAEVWWCPGQLLDCIRPRCNRNRLNWRKITCNRNRRLISRLNLEIFIIDHALCDEPQLWWLGFLIC